MDESLGGMQRPYISTVPSHQYPRAPNADSTGEPGPWRARLSSRSSRPGRARFMCSLRQHCGARGDNSLQQDSGCDLQYTFKRTLATGSTWSRPSLPCPSWHVSHWHENLAQPCSDAQFTMHPPGKHIAAQTLLNSHGTRLSRSWESACSHQLSPITVSDSVGQAWVSIRATQH